ncbi:MAG: MMPL family transporter [Rhodospirillales bacterium]|nr:MMPL family transporter [Rhodospirillales bacterium]
MSDPFSTGRTSRLLTALTRIIVRVPWAVALISLCVSIVGVIHVLDNFSVDTNTNNMLSADLPFRKAQIALDKAFPLDDNTLVILIEGDDLDQVDALGNALSQRLQADTARFGPVFDPAGDPFFRRNGLLFLDLETLAEVTDQLAAAQPFLGAVAADPSLRGLLAVLTLAAEQLAANPAATAGGLSLAPVLDAMTEQVQADAKGRGGSLVWSNLIGGEEASPMAELAGSRIIVTQPPLDFTSLRPGTPAMADVREAARAAGITEESGVRMRLTGLVALAEEELASAQFGEARPELLSFLFVGILSLLCFHSGRLSIAALLTVLAGLIWTATFAVMTAGALNLVSVAFFVLFIGFAIDFTIHYGLRYQEGLALDLDHRAALFRAAAGVGVALALTALCAAIGFFSFVPTTYAGLQQLGYIAGYGMAIALIASMTLFPALLTVLPGRAAPRSGQTDYRNGPAGHWIETHRRLILTLTGVLTAAALVIAPNVRFDFDPLNLKDASSESVQALRDILAAGRQESYAAMVMRPSLAEAQALAARARTLPEVGGAATIASFVPDDQDDKLALIETTALLLAPSLAEPPRSPPSSAETLQALLRFEEALAGLAASGVAATGDDETAAAAGRLLAALSAWRQTAGGDGADLARLDRRIVAGLPTRLDALAAALSPEGVSIETLPANLTGRWVTGDGRHKVEIYPQQGIAGDSQALADFVRAVQAIAPDAAGPSVMIVGAGREIVASFVQAAVSAVIGIAVVLALLLRRLRDVVLSFVPLLLAALFTVAASVLIGLPFNFANVIVLPLLFGLGVSASLNLVVRKRQEGAATQMMASCTPRAVIFSALTTIAAFGTLAVSPHPGISSMGLLLAVAIAMTLICTIIVLPALMAKPHKDA